ncbi:MAG: CidA/LrgA family protein [Bacillota bacterium]|nr:CidA/LrgA family protein [Bacillota bacterium]
MKYLKQFGIILAISCLGELLSLVLPLPIPASIYGIVILFACLQSGLLKLASIRETSTFLIEIMPILFLPAAVGLLEAWDVLKPNLLPIAVITAVSTFVVMGAAGLVTQTVIRRGKKGGEDHD